MKFDIVESPADMEHIDFAKTKDCPPITKDLTITVTYTTDQRDDYKKTVQTILDRPGIYPQSNLLLIGACYTNENTPEDLFDLYIHMDENYSVLAPTKLAEIFTQMSTETLRRIDRK